MLSPREGRMISPKEGRVSITNTMKLPEIRDKRSISTDLRRSMDRTWDNVNVKLWTLKSSERDKLKPYLLRI